jgi:hypothetical protein
MRPSREPPLGLPFACRRRSLGDSNKQHMSTTAPHGTVFLFSLPVNEPAP